MRKDQATLTGRAAARATVTVSLASSDRLNSEQEIGNKMMMKKKKRTQTSLIGSIVPLALVCCFFATLESLSPVNGKVVDFGSKLPEFIDEHTDKSWLIKFYAPWCYHCQQLEPTYVNVAERIYRDHDRLVVGRVDCTKYGFICEKYGVQSYPTITYFNQNTRTVYKGDRSFDSLIDFVARLEGPDFKSVDDCNQLKRITDLHGLIILSADNNTSSAYHNIFKSIALSLKSHYWFYYTSKTCKDFAINDNGLYLLKRHLIKAIKFKPERSLSSSLETDSQEKDLKKFITEWIVRESYPVYGPINSINFDKIMATGKTLVIAILEEYKPARKFIQSSKDFNKIFEELAKRYTQHDGEYMFAWSSDIDLIQSIAIGHVIVPNVMILKPDFSYHLLFKDSKDLASGKENKLSEKLQEASVKMLLASARLDELTFDGGNSYLFRLMRHIFSQYNRFMSMYRANPLLASVLIGLPSLIVLFVLYTTCYDCQNLDEAGDGENLDEEEQQLLNHVKQD